MQTIETNELCATVRTATENEPDNSSNHSTNGPDEDESILIQKSDEEREKIFALYDNSRKVSDRVLNEIETGPGNSADIKSDSYFVDTYGFMHETTGPVTSNGQLSTKAKSGVRNDIATRNDVSDKLLKKLKNREKKWNYMISRWHKIPQKLIRKRVFKGIPKSVRTIVWKLLLGVDKAKQDNPNVYQNMLDLAHKYSTDARQIDLDVNRQFRDNIDYRERYSVKQKSLFHVLVAYAMYNSDVGYCQGMSCIVAILLTYLPIEEDAFWALSILFSHEKYAMHGFFVEGFPKLFRYLNHQDQILQVFVPKLKKHLESYGLNPIIYALKWYLVCFAELLPFSLCLRVWDLFLLEGDRILIAMAFTVLRLHAKFIQELKDMEHILDYLKNNLATNFGYSDDKMIKALKKNMEDLTEKKLDVPKSQPSEKELPKTRLGAIDENQLRQKILLKSRNLNKLNKMTKEICGSKENSHRSLPLICDSAAAAAAAATADQIDCEADDDNSTFDISEEKAVLSTESSLASTMTSTPILTVDRRPRTHQRLSSDEHVADSEKPPQLSHTNANEINAETIAIPSTNQVHYVLRIEVNQSPQPPPPLKSPQLSNTSGDFQTAVSPLNH